MLAGFVNALSPGTTVTVGDWIKDSDGEAWEHVRVADGEGQWMEVRFFGERYWMFTESAYESHMQFLAYMGSEHERAAENREQMEWVAQVCLAYLTGQVEHTTVTELLLPSWGRNLLPRRERVPAVTVFPRGGESAQFVHRASRP